MKRKPYRVILIPAAVCTAVAAFLAFYVIGVIDRSDARDLINRRLDMVCESIDESLVSEKDMYSTYRSKARVVSMMMSDIPNIFSSESKLEEMRVAIGADIISVTDSTGYIKYSTDMSGSSTSALEEFMPAVGNKVFSEALVTESDGKQVIITGSSRLDQPGIIQIQFPLIQSGYTSRPDLSSALNSMPLMKNGHFAVIDADSNTYISHTDRYQNGAPVQFPKEEFESDDGWFSSEYDGKSVLVKYRRHNNMIIAGILPYSEVHHRRNTAIFWTVFSMCAFTLVLLLSMRNYIIRKSPLHK